jgi:hypothetical protein
MKKKVLIKESINKYVLKLIIVLIFILIFFGCIISFRTNCFISDIPKELHEIIIESKSLMDANTVTFLITLIVGLLASLLVLRIDKIDNLVNENKELKSKIDWNVNHVLFSIMLARIERVYYMANIANDTTYTISKQRKKDFSRIGILCSRIAPIIYNIRDSLSRNELNFSIKHEEGKNIMYNYIDDTLVLFTEIINTIKPTNSLMYKNIELLFTQMESIKSIVDKIPITENYT